MQLRGVEAVVRLGHGGRNVLRMVADTFQVGQDIQVNHAVLGRALVLLEAIHMVLGNRLSALGLLAIKRNGLFMFEICLDLLLGF